MQNKLVVSPHDCHTIQLIIFRGTINLETSLSHNIIIIYIKKLKEHSKLSNNFTNSGYKGYCILLLLYFMLLIAVELLFNAEYDTFELQNKICEYYKHIDL